VLSFSVTFFITIFNIGLLFFILRAILFKPVTRFMADREQRIKHDIEHAAQERKRAEELRASYEEKLRAADEEAEKIRAAAREEAAIQAETIIEKGRSEAARIASVAYIQIESDRRASSAQFKMEAASLVLAATGRILRRETNEEDAQRAVAEFVSELETR
jgi:F-type H+-transporting ATPase subunit b